MLRLSHSRQVLGCETTAQPARQRWNPRDRATARANCLLGERSRVGDTIGVAEVLSSKMENVKSGVGSTLCNKHTLGTFRKKPSTALALLCVDDGTRHRLLRNGKRDAKHKPNLLLDLFSHGSKVVVPTFSCKPYGDAATALRVRARVRHGLQAP
jgi:hypothetical protein